MKKSLAAIFAALIAITTILGYRYMQTLHLEISNRLDGRRWELPAVVYARPLELYPGLKLTPDQLEEELRLSDYRLESPVTSSGGYTRRQNTIHLVTRAFTYPTGPESSANIAVTFNDGMVRFIRSTESGEELPFLRLDPVRIGSFHPLEHQDRLILAEEQVPEVLKQSLVAVEDRDFFRHHGVSPAAIIRATLANLKAGRIVQGGSTITQQLVKNFFLDRSQTYSRKFREAAMAVVLDTAYSKDEILTAYINEVFLGQDGPRAIHGFGLASQFHFRRDLGDLTTAQVATLVGMIKGPSAYDPRRHPEQCLARRQLVLNTMHEEGVIDKKSLAAALAEPLVNVAPRQSGFNRFPAFIDLVRRQLRAEYQEDDLRTGGLKILTTMDPRVQLHADRQLTATLTDLEKSFQTKGLEGAVIITGKDDGEVQAVTGGRKMDRGDFNRALDAKRQVGSLVKPAVYLTALEKGYTLASPLLDTAVSLQIDGRPWNPGNYDNKEHGRVALYQALSRSYNLATVRLGMELGIEEVISTLRRLGYEQPLTPYPSLLLGGISMTPLEISAIYQTLASGGFYQPLRSILAVMDENDTTLTRYGLEIEQRFEPERIFLLTHALQRVMTEGTGRSQPFAGQRAYAGKTGTSSDLRDSWFAGFTGNRLAVVWLGRDDNSPIPLTGASGALSVWGRIVESLDPMPLETVEPESIVWHRIDTRSLEETTPLNHDATLLPFVLGEEPSPGTPAAAISRTANTIDKNIKHVEKEARKLIDAIGDLFR